MADNDTKWGFIRRNLLKAVLSFIVIIALVAVIKHFVDANYKAWLEPLQDHPKSIYTAFFISEVIIGLIPPEFFMLWAMGERFFDYFLQLLLFSVLSYIGGIVAFYLGRASRFVPFLKKVFLSEKNEKYFDYFKKYGGILIMLSAVTPIPFGLISTLSGYQKISLKYYLVYASPRVLRFVLYGWILWGVG